MDHRRRAQPAEDRGGLRRLGRAVRRDADIERLSLAHGRIKGRHGLFERRLRVEAVRIEDVDVVQPHALQALVKAGMQIFAAPPFAIGPGPHAVAGLRRDHELVAMVAEIGGEDLAEGALGRARRRAIIVGKVEMDDAEVEGPPAHGTRILQRPVFAEIVPQAKGERRKLEPAPAGAAIEHGVVARAVRDVHGAFLSGCDQRRTDWRRLSWSMATARRSTIPRAVSW